MSACPSTMTLGAALDQLIADLLVEPYEMPIHHCDQEWPHPMPHTEGDRYTWDNGLTITVRLSLDGR